MGQTADQTDTQAIAHVPVITPITGHDDSRSINAFSNEANFATAQRMAKALAASTLVPAEYRNNIPNVVIAMELAGRIGASPFAVMQNIDIIHGRPSWRATFLIATVNTCGRFTPLKFQWTRDTNGKAIGCRAYARERESGVLCEGAEITWEMVKAEGWLDKKGSKWKTMSEQMFMYRAAAFWTRVYAPELSLGMHTRDEVEDMGPAIEVGNPRPSTRTTSALAEKVRSSESEPTTEPNEPEIEVDEQGTVDRDMGEDYGEPVPDIGEDEPPHVEG